MNAQILKQTSAILMLRVTILKGRMDVAVLMDIRAMVKIAQVNKCLCLQLALLRLIISDQKLITTQTFQPSLLVVFHLVVQTGFVKKAMDDLCVVATLVTKETVTTVQVRSVVTFSRILVAFWKYCHCMAGVRFNLVCELN